MLTVTVHTDDDGNRTYTVTGADDVERFAVDLLNDDATDGVLGYDRDTGVITVRAENATLRYAVAGMDDWAPDVVRAVRVP